MKKLLCTLLAVIAVIGCCSCSEKLETVKDESSITIKLSEDNELVLNKIKSGEFKMGSYEGIGDEDELPVRDVTITKDYYIGVYEITQKQWEAVMGNNPSGFRGENLPVESVSWKDCTEFCEKLSKLTGLDVSLPTEAQWEYACRAGSETKWFFGDDEIGYANYATDNIDEKTLPVGNFKANPNGLYDMYGNVMEWCLDYYRGEYIEDDLTDPLCEEESEARVSRGGGWGASPYECRSGYRNAAGENDRTDGIGLRIVVNE